MSGSDDGSGKRKSPGAKSPGFWFFTGDWLKDPELRFCSIFARGLLVDLLCFMFESKERGYLIWPDGSPRSNEDIADAVSGGDRSDKVKAIEELEKKGVLSRDSRGVLYSRRMARLGEISQMRSEAGSKPKAKPEQTANKPGTKGEQKQGVTVSDSDSVSDPLVKTPLIPQGGEVAVPTGVDQKPKATEPPQDEKPKRKPKETVGEFLVPPRLDSPEIREALEAFERMRVDIGHRIKDRSRLCLGWDKAYRDKTHLLDCIQFATANEYQGIKPRYIEPERSPATGKPIKRESDLPKVDSNWEPA
jgi:hypothetical protein